MLRNALDELYHCLAVTLARNVNEYFGIQETKHMLDQLEAKFPDLLKEVLRHATVQRISEVLQRLLSERVSVRNMKLIMEALALWAPREKMSLTLWSIFVGQWRVIFAINSPMAANYEQ